MSKGMLDVMMILRTYAEDIAKTIETMKRVESRTAIAEVDRRRCAGRRRPCHHSLAALLRLRASP